MKKPHFVYYQLPLNEGEEPFAVYAMYIDGQRSDVSAETLHSNGYPIPITPTLSTWANMVTPHG